MEKLRDAALLISVYIGQVFSAVLKEARLKPIRSVLVIFFCWFATVLPARAFAVSASLHSIVLDEQHQTVQLRPYTYFAETGRQLTASDIAQRLALGEYKDLSHKAMTFGYSDSHYWVAFGIRNDCTESTPRFRRPLRFRPFEPLKEGIS